MRKHALDSVDLELYRNRLSAVAEEMGAVLQHTGLSPNITARRDFSCAVFDADGGMVTHAAHIPVHLGSTPLSVRAAIDALDMGPGDVVMLNDPFAGGTHLPDVTVVAPVYLSGPSGRSRPFAYVADRAHHADIGGASPGSMPLATEIYQEGFRAPPVHLVRRGAIVPETRSLFLANTRVPDERTGDLEAQLSALRAGQKRMIDLVARHGAFEITLAMRELQAYSARMVRRFIRTIPRGKWLATDFLDDDGFGHGPIPIRASWRRLNDLLEVDFAGTAAQVRGPLNTNLAVTTSAVFYVIASLVGREIPANRGMMDPVRIRAPLGSIVNCRFPAAVAGGNVETSQRIVDVLLRALARALPERIPAASCGSMTNIALGGYDSARGRHFAYYETVGGGAGAGPRREGASALQTHMTNTLNTPIEVLEAYYPLRVTRYAIRRGSGGIGLHRGGDGIDREIEAVAKLEATLLADRRIGSPTGIAGGESGAPGLDTTTSRRGSERIPSKVRLELEPGDRIRVRTPGGGGWGRSRAATPKKVRRRGARPSRARRGGARSPKDDA